MSHEPDPSPEQDRSLTNKLVSQRTIVPFEDYREYLEEELNCVQHLVRAHLVRSMSFADDRARPIEAFLRKSFTMHRDVPAPEQLELCDVHKHEASELRKLIEARLSKTDERLLRTFPLWHVADQLLELRKRDKPRRLNTLDQDILLITLLHEHWASVRAAIDSSYLEDGTLPGFLSGQWLAECLSSHRETPLSVLKRLQSGGLLSRCGLIEVFEDRNHPTLHRVRVDDTIAEYLLNKSLNDHGCVRRRASPKRELGKQCSLTMRSNSIARLREPFVHSRATTPLMVARPGGHTFCSRCSSFAIRSEDIAAAGGRCQPGFE